MSSLRAAEQRRRPGSGSMRAWWWWTLAFGIVIVAVRLACAEYPLYWDEWISIFFAHLPASRLWSDWMVNESNPPLYYTLLKGWLGLFGSTPYNARLLSVAGGLLAAIALSLCSHRLFGLWGALATYLICALSAQDVFYSVFVRAYVFVLLAFAVSLLGMLTALKPDATPQEQKRGLALYAAGAVAAIYLHTTMLLWPVAASLVACGLMIVDKSARKLLVPGLVAHLAIALLAAWWVWLTLRQVAGGAHWVVWQEPMSGHEYLSNLRQSVMFLRMNTGVFKLASYLLIAAAFLPLLKRDRTVVLIASLLLVSIGLFFAAQLIKPIIYQKTVWWMSGLTMILVSGAIAQLRSLPVRIGALGLLGCLLAADLVLARPGFATHDWTSLVRYAASRPQATVVMGDKEAGIIFDEACRAEFAGRCPIRTLLVLREAPAASWADAYAGPQRMWSPGEPAPVNGPAILLRDGLLDAHWTVSSTRELRFGGLKVLGPAPLDALMRPR